MAKYKRKDNNFSEETRELFIDNYVCWECGMNTWDCLHHVLPGEYSDSPFNAAPLCNAKCHINNGHYFSELKKRQYLNDTALYLLKHSYLPTERDIKFIELNKAFYNEDILNKLLK